MSAAPRVLLVNPNSSPSTTARLLALAETAYPGLRFTAIADAQAPTIITGPDALDAAAARMARLQVDLPELADMAAVIVCAFGDPGADALSERMRVPVVGIGAASVRAASALGPWAIATTTPALEQRLSQLAQEHGGGGAFLGSVFTTSAAERLAGDEARTLLELRSAVNEAADRGAVAVVIGGGPLADAAAALHARAADVAIVQPLLAALDEVAAVLLAAPAR